MDIEPDPPEGSDVNTASDDIINMRAPPPCYELALHMPVPSTSTSTDKITTELANSSQPENGVNNNGFNGNVAELSEAEVTRTMSNSHPHPLHSTSKDDDDTLPSYQEALELVRQQSKEQDTQTSSV